VETDDLLERTILELLDRRAPGATICPSDAARAVGGDDWRRLMEPVRAAAGRLVAEGLVEVRQRGEPVDVAAARGPVRIARTTRD
jgi:hypothetical protein